MPTKLLKDKRYIIQIYKYVKKPFSNFDFSFGDFIFISYGLIKKKRKKFYVRKKEFFGRCITVKKFLRYISFLLRKQVKLNVLEQLFLADYPYYFITIVKKFNKKVLKKWFWLRTRAPSYSKVREFLKRKK